VVESLRRNILDGVYAVGSRLPTEAELSEGFGVSRQTIREALRQLRADGLISSRQGSGSTVTGTVSPQAFVHELGAISDLIQYASSMTFRVDRSEMLKADAELAARLQATPGSKWLRVEGSRHANADGALVCVTVLYVPAEFSGVARLVGRASGAVYELIEALYGVRIAEVDQTVHARPAPPALSGALGVEADSTVIEVVRVYRLQSGQTAEVAVNLYPPERFSMTMKLRSVNA
jgi:DNA-binding GntR family transcriptional regulator